MNEYDIFKFVKMMINHTMEHPRSHSSSPKELDIVWRSYDDVLLYILFGDDRTTYSSGSYLVGKRGMNALGYSGEMIYSRGMTDEDEIYKCMIELRKEYEVWLKERALEICPEKAGYLEQLPQDFP